MRLRRQLSRRRSLACPLSRSKFAALSLDGVRCGELRIGVVSCVEPGASPCESASRARHHRSLADLWRTGSLPGAARRARAGGVRCALRGAVNWGKRTCNDGPRMNPHRPGSKLAALAAALGIQRVSPLFQVRWDEAEGSPRLGECTPVLGRSGGPCCSFDRGSPGVGLPSSSEFDIAGRSLQASTSGMRSGTFELSVLALVAALGSCAPSAPGRPGSEADADAAREPGAEVPSTSTADGGAPRDGAAIADTGAGDAGDAPCTATTVGRPRSAPYPVVIGGQEAWSHDDGFSAGYFHTYDALDVGVAGDRPHKVHVFLPRNYDACEKGYPVVYMNDGQTAFWTGGSVAQSWRVAETLDAGYRSGKIPKVIVVAIVPNDREYEYSYARAAPGAACCGADQYTSYVADRVRDFVDRTYRTLRGPRNTAVVGSSRGGLSAFYLATRRPDVFGKAACLSPSFWAGLDPVFGGDLAGGSLEQSGLLLPVTSTLGARAVRPRLWIDWGLVRAGGFGNDTIEAAATLRGREMVAVLKTKYGYIEPDELSWEEDPVGGHDEGSWARRLPRVLEALFR